MARPTPCLAESQRFARCVTCFDAPAGGRELVPTGIAIAIPPGHAGFVLPRSGNALHHGVTVANGPGLIDAAYRGEVKVILLNTDPHRPFEVRRGDRIAQLVVQRVEQVRWRVVAAHDGDDRGQHRRDVRGNMPELPTTHSPTLFGITAPI